MMNVKTSEYQGLDELRRAAVLEKKCVLVVDAEQRVLNFIRIQLQADGYQVLTCLTCEQALRLAESEEPDIILLDMLMPGIDGFEVLKELRSHTRAPVIALSIDDSVASETLRLGAAEFLAKPFRTDDLVAAIERILAHSD